MSLGEKPHGILQRKPMPLVPDVLIQRPTSSRCRLAQRMNQCQPSLDASSVVINGKRTSSLSSSNWFSTRILVLVVIFILFKTCVAQKTFKIVIYTCLWQRPLLTEFVLDHYVSLKPMLFQTHDIHLDVFTVGSEGEKSAAIAAKFNASYVEHQNQPLGAKHNFGLSVLRKKIPDVDAVVIIGSDDILNHQYFVTVKDLMTRKSQPMHMVGLKDLFFYDLGTKELVYTRGYRSVTTEVAATIGLGRALSKNLLDCIDWFLWDPERNHGLDQSTVRRLLRNVIGVDYVSTAVLGKENGIVAIDIKTDSVGGTNIWAFDKVLKAVGKGGRLYEFEHFQSDGALSEFLGKAFVRKVNLLGEKIKAR